MDTGATTRYRYDLMEYEHLTRLFVYSLLMAGTPGEDKGYWKNECDERLQELEEFFRFRQEENWSADSKYLYKATLTSW